MGWELSGNLQGGGGDDPTVRLVNLYPFSKRTPFKTGQTTTATTLSASASATDSTITLTSVTGLSTDVLLILNPGTATQETAVIASVAGSVVTLTAPLAYAHASGQAVGPVWTDPIHMTSNGYKGAAYEVARATDIDTGEPIFDLASGDHFTYIGNSWIGNSSEWEDQMEAAFPGSVGLNAGYSGDGSPEMIARFNNPPTNPSVSRGVDPDSKYIIFNEPGGNDFMDKLSTETFFTNFGTLIRLCWAVGAIPVYVAGGPIQYDVPNTLQLEDTIVDLLRAGSVEPIDAIAALGSRDLGDWFPNILTQASSTAGGAGLTLPHGVAPTSPTDGDIWTTSAGVYARISGVTVGPLGSAGDASTTVKGLVELATSAETTTGTDTVRATTPAGVKAAIDAAVAALIDGAPGAIDTLNELAAAIGDDANFATTISNALALKAPLASPTFTGTVSGITKSMVGLPNVDNTSNATERAAAATLTNKRITKRIVSTASTATLTINSDSYDGAVVTAQAAGLTIAAPTGTPTDQQSLIIRIKDNGTARALTWNSAFRAIGVTLPTTTVASKTLYVGCIRNTDDTKWDVIAVAAEA